MQNYKQKLSFGGKEYYYYSLQTLGEKTSKLPFSLKILLENLLRRFDGQNIASEDLLALIDQNAVPREITFLPARILMQDLTGVPAVVDLAAMRDAVSSRGYDPKKVNPFIPVDLIIDHSIMVDNYGNDQALEKNIAIEYDRNIERYQFLKWGQKAFKNFRVISPGMGICHQINLEYLAKVLWVNGDTIYPDTVLGTDSHTTMINGLGVLGWGVGGIEAEAAMLGQPTAMLVPKVLGVELTGHIPAGVTATDLVLTITNQLRIKGVVGKFVEFFGTGLSNLSLADRATIANMAPEYGATCGFFPIDEETLNFLRTTNRDEHHISLVEKYAKIQGLWHEPTNPPIFNELLKIDLSKIEPSVAGPKRPQDRINLSQVPNSALQIASPSHVSNNLKNHDVVIAAITSCTNTSNPYVMVCSGLLARNARKLGIKAKRWVKTSLAPGSKVVTEYLEKSGLLHDLEQVGFYLVGYGCTTCIGNSGPLDEEITEQIKEHDLTVAGVLSGNRNFEGRIHPLVKANYLASPPLVVAYAIAGSTLCDLTNDPIAQDENGRSVYLKDLWPSDQEIKDIVKNFVNQGVFDEIYSKTEEGDEFWQNIKISDTDSDVPVNFPWNNNSTYIKSPPYFSLPKPAGVIENARVLALLGDSVTTDHISPAGNIKYDSPAGLYLRQKNVGEFNSYGARRGNHEVMIRGTLANIRLQNQLTPEIKGGFTYCFVDNQVKPIYDAAQTYQQHNIPLVIIAGKEYGTGSSRDWAAKGTRLLGVSAVIAQSFERIHRSNLIGMGVLPLTFPENFDLKLTGQEIVHIKTPEHTSLTPQMILRGFFVNNTTGITNEVPLLCRIDTKTEMEYFNCGGVLSFVLEKICN